MYEVNAILFFIYKIVFKAIKTTISKNDKTDKRKDKLSAMTHMNNRKIKKKAVKYLQLRGNHRGRKWNKNQSRISNSSMSQKSE